MEPYTPWSNAAGREIEQLKKGAGHKLLRSRASKHLWDDCLELEAYIGSNTAHEIYMLDKEVPKTVMSGKTSDISQFFKLEWFKWVTVQDETVSFPDDVLKLGHYLGLSTNVGPAITTTENGQVLHRITYRPLTSDEFLDKDRSDAQEQFMARAYEKLGSWVLPRELENIGLENTPQYDPYEDETQNEQMIPQLAEELEPMPEVCDHYIGAKILLPRGDKMTMGHVVVAMPVEILWEAPIQILSLIPECIK